MLLGIGAIEGDLFGGVQRVMRLHAIDRYRYPQVIQLLYIDTKEYLPPAMMRDQAGRSASLGAGMRDNIMAIPTLLKMS